jgi:hypothetical protein
MHECDFYKQNHWQLVQFSNIAGFSKHFWASARGCVNIEDT